MQNSLDARVVTYFMNSSQFYSSWEWSYIVTNYSGNLTNVSKNVGVNLDTINDYHEAKPQRISNISLNFVGDYAI